jgi:hypothetical protein
MSRTIANSTEAILLIVALDIWNEYSEHAECSTERSVGDKSIFNRLRTKYTPFPQIKYFLVSLSAYLRPTAACFWATIVIIDFTSKLYGIFGDFDTKLWTLPTKLKVSLRYISSISKFTCPIIIEEGSLYLIQYYIMSA